MSSKSQPAFKYGALSPEDAETLRGIAKSIKARSISMTKTIIEIGGNLISAKHRLAHGSLKVWVEVECGLAMRSAQNYMRAAAFASGKCDTVSLLSPGALYLLSARSAPSEGVAAVMRLLENGRVPSEPEVQEILCRFADPGPQLPAKEDASDRAREVADEVAACLGTKTIEDLVAHWPSVRTYLIGRTKRQATPANAAPPQNRLAASEEHELHSVIVPFPTVGGTSRRLS